MIVTVNVSSAAVMSMLKNGQERKGQVISDTLNDVAKMIQAKERSHVKASFIVRKEQFTMRQAAIISFANPKKLQAKIYVGRKKRHFLHEFERGGDRLAQRELRRLGVPGVGVPRAARPTKQSIVQEADWISNLKLVRKQRAGSVGPGVTRPAPMQTASRIWRVMKTAAKIQHASDPSKTFVGVRGTFLIPGYGIYQRAGAAVRKLYLITTRPVRLPARLKFIETAKAEATRFNELLSQRVAQAFKFDFHGGTP